MNAAFSAATEQKWKIYILLKTERTSFIPLNLTTELLHVSIEAKGGGEILGMARCLTQL